MTHRQPVALELSRGQDLATALRDVSDDYVLVVHPDDELLPTAAEAVSHAFRDDAAAVHVQWPHVVRASGDEPDVRPVGMLATGDLVPRLMAGGVDTCVFASRSGHAYRRDFLLRALPHLDESDRLSHLTLPLMAAAAGRTVALFEPQSVESQDEEDGCGDALTRALARVAALERCWAAAASFWEAAGTSLPLPDLRRLSAAHRAARMLSEIEHALPRGITWALVDEDLWREQLLPRGHDVVPFPNHDGAYWGPPADDDDALEQLRAARESGAGALVVAWSSYWWFDVYPRWAQELQEGHRTVSRTSEAVIFALGEPPDTRAGASPPAYVSAPSDERAEGEPDSAAPAARQLIEELGGQFQLQLRALVEPGTPCALLDFPDHANVGDSAIWLGERIALARAGLQPSYLCSMTTLDAAELRAAVGDGVIFLHGGGNFGDLYPAHQAFRERVAREFPDNPIVQLPQSVNFRRRAAAERARSVLNAHRDFTLLVRDRHSIDVASCLFERQPLLTPDAAFVLGPLARPESAVVPIRWLARTDFEAGAGDASASGIDRFDWVLPPDDVDPASVEEWWRRADGDLALTQWDRQALAHLYRGVREISLGRVLITDRLHGHVLSTLIGVPHVLLNDAFSKVHDCYAAWTARAGLAHPVRTAEEAVLQARRLAGPVEPVERSGRLG